MLAIYSLAMLWLQVTGCLTHLKGARPVPLALSRSDTQLKAAISIVPVEGRLHSRSKLPHQSGVALAPLQRLIAVVEQDIPGRNCDDLQQGKVAEYIAELLSKTRSLPRYTVSCWMTLIYSG